MTPTARPGVAGAASQGRAEASETGFDARLYERFPTTGERPPDELDTLKKVWTTPSGLRRLSAVNNNQIGFLFIVTAFAFFVAAGILALVMRVQLTAPLADIVPQAIYNQLFTMHGSVMMFLFAVPAIEAVAMMLLPQMLAARDLPFPRLSAYSYWAYAVGGTVFFSSIFFSLAPADGWFMYPPLSSGTYSKGINADVWLLGIGFIEISALAGAIELIVGVLRTRPPGMTLAKMPVYAWAILIFGVMIILAFPAMIMVTFLLELERAFNWPLFDATRGGDPLLYQHLFWFFGHPDVYIIFIPASAMVSTMVVTVAQKPLVAHELVVLSMIATAFISFGVWAHHMFTVGMPRRVGTYLPGRSWDLPNLVSTVGAFVMAAGVLVFLIDAVRCFRRASDGNARNVFNGGTLEWLATGNFAVRSIPVVSDLEPLWADPTLRQDVEAGRYFLPGAATGQRETLVTSPLRAEPQYVQTMPGPSWWPLLSALFTAGFFLLLTMKATTLSAACAVLTVLCLMRWVWSNDRHLPQKQVDAGAGIQLPTYFAGPQSHGWWAAVLLDIVLGMIFLMAMFAYLYLLGANPEAYRVAAPQGALWPGLALLAAAAGLAWAARPVMARFKYGSGLSALMLTASMLCLVAALVLDGMDWWQAGLRGSQSGQGAAIYAMMAWHAAVVTAVVLSAVYYVLRWMRGLAPGPANKTMEALRLLFIYAALEGAAGLLLPRGVPWGFA